MITREKKVNSKAQGLLEADAARKLFRLGRLSPFNSRVRDAVRLAIANRKRFPNNYTRQQARASDLEAFKEIQAERRAKGEI
jgi:hypothetical protein